MKGGVVGTEFFPPGPLLSCWTFVFSGCGKDFMCVCVCVQRSPPSPGFERRVCIYFCLLCGPADSLIHLHFFVPFVFIFFFCHKNTPPPRLLAPLPYFLISFFCFFIFFIFKWLKEKAGWRKSRQTRGTSKNRSRGQSKKKKRKSRYAQKQNELKEKMIFFSIFV